MATAKQRYYANQAKKGKISKSQAAAYGVSEKNKPKTTSKISSSGGSNSSGSVYDAGMHNSWKQYDMMNGTNYADVYQKATSNPSQPWVQEGITNYETKNSSDSSSGSSNRSKAATVAPSAPTGLKPASGTTSPLRGMLSSGLNIVKNTSPILGGISRGINSLGVDLTDLLGIPKAQAASPGLVDGWENLTPAQQEIASTTIRNSANGNGGGVTDALVGETNQNDPTSIFKSAIRNNPNNTSPYINQNDNPNNSSNQRTSSRPVSNPTYTPPQSSLISSLLSGGNNNPQSAPQDFSNNTQTKDNTMRQLPGNGYFSNGIASNGKGDYGIEGAMTGTDQNNIFDELLTLVGLKPQTALAADNTMFPQTQSMQSVFQPKNDYTSSPIYQDTLNRMYGQSNEPITSIPQYAQTNPATQYYQDSIKGYGKQEKDTERAYKKALKEMLKGIEAQYATSRTTGENDLNKQKANDLQALASRFSFGLNQDPNSEQAMQYQQRTANDYAGQLTDFLAKLAAAKTQDINNARSNNQSQLQSVLSQIQNQRSSAQEKLAQLLYQMQKDSQKGGETLKNGSYTIIPGANGENKYVYNNGSQYVPITADQYMAGKYGLGIAGNNTPISPEEMSDEELQAIVNGY